MGLSRRTLMLPALAAGLLAAAPAFAIGKDEAALTKNLETLRLGLKNKDKALLESITAPQLSYSHSDGHIEDRPTFVTNAVASKSVLKSLDFNDPTIAIVGGTAIVRFKYVSDGDNEGKKVNNNLGILSIWQKQGTQWKLLARSSTKL